MRNQAPSGLTYVGLQAEDGLDASFSGEAVHVRGLPWAGADDDALRLDVVPVQRPFP